MPWDIYWVPTKEEGVYLHYAIDITEQKRIQSELEESNQRFKDSEDKICKRISAMKQNCFRLMRLINNLIVINKVDCGFITMHWA